MFIITKYTHIFLIKELQHLIDEFKVDHLEEAELDEFEENVSNILNQQLHNKIQLIVYI